MFHRWVARLTDKDLTKEFLYAEEKEAKEKYGEIMFDKRGHERAPALGSGTFGEVYAATYHDQRVAVKEMAISKPSRVKMFNSEVAFMKKLRHPNIVKLVDGFQYTENIYIMITEICSGGELFDAIADNGHLKISDAQRVLRDVLSAVQYMHDMNVVHRDLKPENILLSVPWISGGDIPPVKVIDLGLAADWKGTPLYDVRGTPYYIAPEVIVAKKNVSGYGKECDLFSVGVILFVMLSGYPPFYSNLRDRRANDNEVFWKIVNDQPDYNDVPETTKSFIKRLLIKDPSERPSARAAMDDPFLEANAGHIKVSVENLRSFVKMSKLKRLIRHEIAASLTVADQKRYLDAFGNGETMSKKDAQAKLLSYGIEESKIEEFFDALDQNNNKKWDVVEFIAAVMEKHLYDTFETVRRAFGKLDKDGNGYITWAELQKVVGKTNANAIMEEMHGNGDDKDRFNFHDLETYFENQSAASEAAEDAEAKAEEDAETKAEEKESVEAEEKESAEAKADKEEDTGSKAEEKDNRDADDFGVNYGQAEMCSVQ